MLILWRLNSRHVDIAMKFKLNFYREAERMFVAEIYIPVLQSLSRDIGNIDVYDGQDTLDEVPAPPPNTPEITLKANQVCSL